ncbi:hypothetical protein CFR73_09865 [Novacetimonas maltaceti]|uniref:Phage tail lysozyme domain-containing protein n=1 Tax=Novacetimonas maltaceti TaxID=1203393 RepID=A0A2S3W412_9PROT|nr:hypothetical protein [Novacetimonas maltaceti]POF63614.1 hypothetical protein KMAL_07940 [Novacetimonas maltaceti]PYD59881.1 hypothetical protein CFR73_09865 [Novacetimonas maltaceti]
MAPVTNSPATGAGTGRADGARGLSRAMRQVRQFERQAPGFVRTIAARRRAAMALFDGARPSPGAARAAAAASRRAGAAKVLLPGHGAAAARLRGRVRRLRGAMYDAMYPVEGAAGRRGDEARGPAGPPGAAQGDDVCREPPALTPVQRRAADAGGRRGHDARGPTGPRSAVRGDEARREPPALTPVQHQAVTGGAVASGGAVPPMQAGMQRAPQDGAPMAPVPQGAPAPADDTERTVLGADPRPPDRKLRDKETSLREMRTIRVSGEMGFLPLVAVGAAGSGGQGHGFDEVHRGDAGRAFGVGQWQAPRAQAMMQGPGIGVRAARIADQVRAYGLGIPSGPDAGARKAGRRLLSGFRPPGQASAPLHGSDPRPEDREEAEGRQRGDWKRGDWADVVSRQLDMANTVPGAMAGHKTEVHVGDIIVHANTHDGNRIATQIHNQLRQSLPALTNTGQR